jgi:hypothetical protein
MTQTEAVNALIQAVQLATTKGAFTLADTKLINQAIDALTIPTNKTVEDVIQSESTEPIKNNNKK